MDLHPYDTERHDTTRHNRSSSPGGHQMFTILKINVDRLMVVRCSTM
jgi:hypothetical protein